MKEKEIQEIEGELFISLEPEYEKLGLKEGDLLKAETIEKNGEKKLILKPVKLKELKNK